MAETTARTPFDPAPVVADVLHLLAHPEELRSERLPMCGSCFGSGSLQLPGGRGRTPCHICEGRGER